MSRGTTQSDSRVVCVEQTRGGMGGPRETSEEAAQQSRGMGTAMEEPRGGRPSGFPVGLENLEGSECKPWGGVSRCALSWLWSRGDAVGVEGLNAVAGLIPGSLFVSYVLGSM